MACDPNLMACLVLKLEKTWAVVNARILVTQVAMGWLPLNATPAHQRSNSSFSPAQTVLSLEVSP